MNTTADRSDTLAMLCDSLARYLDDHYSFEQRLHTLAAAQTTPPRFWRGLASELGLLGVALPEAQGGLDGGVVAHLAVMTTLGGALAAEPYLSAIVIGATLLQRHPGAQADALLARILVGDALPVLAHAEPQSRHERSQVQTRLVRAANGFELHGHEAVVQAAPWASHFIMSACSAEDAEGLSLALEQAAALTASVGEMLTGADVPPAVRARAVLSVKVATAAACKAVGQGAVQLHGGMGMTEELAVGHYFRRATLIGGLFGPASWHVRRVARLAVSTANS